MHGIDLKPMWTTLRPNLLVISKFFDALINDPHEIMQRGLIASGILRPTSTQSVLGFIWAIFVWIVLLPPVMIASLVALVVVFPLLLVWWAWCLLAWPFTGRWADLRAPVASRIAEISDTVRTFSQQTWRQRLLSGLKSIGLELLTTAFCLVGVFVFLTVVWLGFFLWWAAFLASSHLFGYGIFTVVENASTGDGNFTTVCHYRTLTQRETISMTFNTRAARDAYFCPGFKRMGHDKN